MLSAACSAQAGKPGEGVLELTITDRDSGQPLPCRIHLQSTAGVARKVNKLPFWHDHFACPGKVTLTLPKGNYTFTIEHGPEYADRSGHFTINDYSQDQKVVDLKRAVNMADEGWWAGDLHVHRSQREIELLMQADELYIAPLITWTNKKDDFPSAVQPADRVVNVDGRYYDTSAGEDERASGTFLFHRLNRPLLLPTANHELPTAVDLARQAHAQPDGWVDVANPTSWDLPVLLAAGQVDSIELLSEDLLRSGTRPLSRGKSRTKAAGDSRKPAPREQAAWLQEIYFHMLNCGLRIPPSAGSGSGVAPNPLGFNRMYVYVDKTDFSYDTWWESLRAGRVTVSNGPLIRPFANEQVPGHVFELPEGEKLDVDVAMNLATRDKISYLEIIMNGRVASTVRLEDWAKTGHFPPFKCSESGWFLVRVVCDVPDRLRCALSGPWYVESTSQPRRVSRRSAKFFLDWLNERAAQIKDEESDVTAHLRKQCDEARAFWENLVSQANVD